ncbi:hypothetical protein PT974_06932 [Cladobotryum mycophilum]|uniref:Uncharacterized protein n=1 Tax=Cladobotryum mycophilum TaxID=491253 RepID=A0ABR0SP24_9HYPO
MDISPASFGDDSQSAEDDSSPTNNFYSNPINFFNAIGRPAPRLPSAADVRAEAKKRAITIFFNYELLNGILQRHEATIQKRWTKKTRQQRINTLLKAWPGMPSNHRPDYEAFRRAGSKTQLRAKSGTDSFMWPYINQEDLSQTQPLLLLLNARGHEIPSSFAAADYEAMHLGIVCEVIERSFLNQYTMMLHRVTAPEEYGKLLAWDDHPDAFDWMQTQKQFSPGDGLVILEAQDKLMKFLVDCCQDILHDINKDQLISSTYPIQPEIPLRTGRESCGFESLALMAAEAPYRVPAQLELGRIESLLAAKTRAAEDHLWALREDPVYFRQHLLDAREHRQELIKDTHDRSHPTLIPGREGLFWARVIGNTLVDAYLELEVFSELQQQVKELVSLQKEFESIISPMEDLPKEYMIALLTFRHFLNQTVKGPLAQLKQTVVASPPMRRLYVRIPPIDDTSSKLSIMSKGAKMTKIEGQLIYLLRTLWEDGNNLFLLRLSCVVDELERLLLSEPTASDLISQNVASIIGNISIISQCLHQLEIYQPWAQNFEAAALDIKADLEKGFASKSKPWAQIHAAFKDTNLAKVVKLGEPLLGNFIYPFDKRRTKENVDKLRRAERNLDIFWAEVDRLTHSRSSKLQGSAVQRLLSQAYLLQRTPEWVEQQTPQNVVTIPIVEQPLSPLYFGLRDGPSQEQATARIWTKPVKVKVKTRGAIGQPTEASESVELGRKEEEDKTQPCFRVNNRALKVFRTLFFNPDITSTPGEVLWTDFVHAMTSIGFTAQKLYGSVWQFSPTEIDVEVSIQFHEPHPRGRIPFMVARRQGRRLTRAYGWAGNMFILNK